MRYLALLLFSSFLIFSVDFATQNTEIVNLKYSLEWLNLSYQSKRPVFVPVFFSFAFGIMFSVIYFIIYHLLLLKNLRQQKKEIKRLNSLVKSQQEKHSSLEERNNELQRIDQHDLKRVDGQSDIQSQIPQENEELKTSS